MAKKIHNIENEKNGDGQKNNKNDGSVMLLLKIDMHCEGCAKKVVKTVYSLEGVELVKRGDNDFKKITVIGKVNPVKLCENVEQKLKKKVELISPVINKNNDGKNSNNFDAKTVAVKEDSKPKKIQVTTTVLKMSLHCQGCIDKIRKTVKKTEGFMEMSIDKSKDLVIVKGGIDVNKLITTLKNKHNIKAEVVPVKDNISNDGGKKGKRGGGDGEEKENGDGVQVVEGQQNLVNQNQYMYPYPQYIYEPQYPFGYNMHASQMFNDENPNACVVM
ncbi:heavy metal-associated isoprenylated plant protein 3-like [Rutidosis leptorrhynchoides]|uniref:heavy metal-associated isoprenylated plant protein 3-like n=1 Tax=Rutidosis leptorrhynchoides TaxID=125765 RepID=UPI003A9A5FD6